MAKPDELRRLAALLRAEMDNIDRTVKDIEELRLRPRRDRFDDYAAAHLLEGFYTGVEKAFTRIAAELGGLPKGPAWHDRLLRDMTLELPAVRPAVLAKTEASGLQDYLAFRHLARHLYGFELDAGRIEPLLAGLVGAWRPVRAGLLAFAGALDSMAAALD